MAGPLAIGAALSHGVGSATVTDLVAGPEWSAEPVSHLLGRLSTSQQELTADEAMMLAMPAGTGTGNAAVALLLAVEDPAGPRCRFYPAAYSLQDIP